MGENGDGGALVVYGRDERGEWSAETRELAFELWMGQGGRKLVAVRSLLAGEPWRADVPYQTLYRWRDSDHWEDEADSRLKAIQPLLADRIPQAAMAGVDRGISVLLAGLDDPSARLSEKVAAVRVLAEIAGIVGKGGTSLAFRVNNPGIAGPQPGDRTVPEPLRAPRFASVEGRSSVADRLAALLAGDPLELGSGSSDDAAE